MIFLLDNKLIKTKSELTRVCRNLNHNITLVNGTFDYLHPGHYYLLYKARMLGFPLLVLLNSDSSVKRLKGKDRPIFKLSDRVFCLLSLSYVDYVYVFKEDRITSYFEIIRPKLWVKGSDYKDSIDPDERMEAIRFHVKIHFVKRTAYSSSKILKKLIKSEN